MNCQTALMAATCLVGILSQSSFAHSNEVHTRVEEMHHMRMRMPSSSQYISREQEQRRKSEQCGSNKNGTPLFLRADLAYSVTGIDCFGDQPSGYSTENGKAPMESREPASILREPTSLQSDGAVYRPVQ